MPSDPTGIDPHFDYKHGILRNVPGYTTQAILDRFEAAEAGEFRQVKMSRSASYPFAVVQFLKMNLDNTLAKLAEEDDLKGLDADAFAGRAAYYLGELNSIHPFREGNGRTQREFIRQLAAEVGHRINWSRVTRRQMIDASIESHDLGRNAAFAALIVLSMEPAHTL